MKIQLDALFLDNSMYLCKLTGTNDLMEIQERKDPRSLRRQEEWDPHQDNGLGLKHEQKCLPSSQKKDAGKLGSERI